LRRRLRLPLTRYCCKLVLDSMPARTASTLKGGESQRFKNGLCGFETSAMRGFQEGNIALDKGVLIQAFDNQDHLLTLIFGTEPGKVCFGRPELNHIIFSLRPVTASE
jgi:hypothetical protein